MDCIVVSMPASCAEVDSLWASLFYELQLLQHIDKFIIIEFCASIFALREFKRNGSLESWNESSREGQLLLPKKISVLLVLHFGITKRTIKSDLNLNYRPNAVDQWEKFITWRNFGKIQCAWGRIWPRKQTAVVIIAWLSHTCRVHKNIPMLRVHIVYI